MYELIVCVCVLDALVAQLLSSDEVESATLVRIYNEAVLISDSTNTIGKVINRTILPPALGK